MLELELLGVQCLSHQGGGGVFRVRTNGREPRFKPCTVRGISQNRMADMREMHAYLMRPAGLQNEAQERDISS